MRIWSICGAEGPELAAAAARIRCGLILLDTDLLSDGEAYVRAGLGVLEAAPGGAEAYLAWLLEAYNSLGALYSNRGSYATALEWLQKAEALYQRVQEHYTSTLYFMAQVYGNQKLADRSALYCAATLYRQLAGVVDRDTAAGAELGEDIAANIKVCEKHEGREGCEGFPGLAVPSPDSFPWGASALVTTFEAARELLNTGMPFFKAALAYYQLDGWVTDHVGILMDMSNMCLAGFEADPGRAAAMHRCRAQLLEPLSGGLNPDHYPGLSRSIDLELAHIYREVSDAPLTRHVNAAAPNYSALVMAAHKHLQWTTEYVKRHKLEDWTREAQAAEELSELLVEQMRLRAMAAAQAANRKGNCGACGGAAAAAAAAAAGQEPAGGEGQQQLGRAA
eukprot:XP_001698313.1 predicted protein [Chlamydomonas reinhardtii]